MQGNKKTSGLNNVAIFFSSKHFVYPVLSSSQIDWLISEYIVFCILDNTQSLSLYILYMISFCMVLRTFVELENHFLAYIPADWQSFDSSWYNLIPVLSWVTKSIVPSMYVDSNTTLDPIENVSVHLLACSMETNCASNDNELKPNTV